MTTKKIIAIVLCVAIVLSTTAFTLYKTVGSKMLYPYFYTLDGNAKQYRLDSVLPAKDSRLCDKSIIFLGSSVTVGYGSCGVSFADYLQQIHSLNITKEAVGGTTLVSNDDSSYIPRMLTIDKSIKADAFVCQLSTNDATKNMPQGTVGDSKDINSFDTSTVAGAIEYIVCYAQSTWNCPVVFYTGSYYDSENYSKMVEILYDVQAKWGIAIIDLWTNHQFNTISSEQRALYMLDDIHPTMAGYLEWWLPEFEKVLFDVVQ